jgi:hypothetical protein
MHASRTLVGSRLRSLTLLMMGVLGAGSLAGCRKTAAGQAGETALNEASVKRSQNGLQGQLGQLEAKFSVLRKQVEAVPPELPGFSQLRAQFYSTEEARGIIDAKVTLIANRLASASGSRRPEELRQISKDIAETYDEVRQIDELHASLAGRVRALARTGRDNEVAREPGSAPPVARTR